MVSLVLSQNRVQQGWLPQELPLRVTAADRRVFARRRHAARTFGAAGWPAPTRRCRPLVVRDASPQPPTAAYSATAGSAGASIFFNS